MSIVTRAPVWLVLGLGFIAVDLAQSQQLPPFGYYASATNTTGATLKSALHNIIKGHTVIPYDSSGVDAHDALVVLDRDPTNSANVLLIYSGYSVAASTWPSWNREHIWPESFGTDVGTQNSDLFNLRACNQGVNSSRNNKYYDASTTPVSHYSGAPDSSYDGDSWEPRDADKGFVARACFYMTTRYDGTGGDVNLQLADSPNIGTHVFTKLAALLDWNRRFPPTNSERIRNDAIYQSYQLNRNPFIDNPDFADMVLLGVDGFAAWRGTHFDAAELSNATVSAAAADPDGDGLPNIAEYTFGHDPHVADGNAIQTLSLQTVNATNYLYVTHHRHHYLSGVSLTYQVSTNMTVWEDVTAELVTNTQIDVQKDLVTVRFPANGPSEFVRFKLHRLTDGPMIVEDEVTLISEGCAPGNGVIDPGETVALGFSLKNVGTTDTSNLVVTLQATGGVTLPGAGQNYGVVTVDGAAVSRSFTFIATGTCGENLTATLQLQDGSTDLGILTFTFPLGQTTNPLNESFDSVLSPALPDGWTTAASGAQSNWVTSTMQADSTPNAAFSPEPDSAGLNELDTPSFIVNSASAQLTFLQNFNLTASTTNSSLGYNGGVLEIKIGSGSFQDILAAGGTFVSGGYNTTLSGDLDNPLAGREAWSGNSLGFLTTTVSLPAAAEGQNVQLRWRCGTGNSPIAPLANVHLLSASGTLAYWNFDGSSSVPNIATTNISVVPVTVSNVGGSLTYFEGNPGGLAVASRAFTQSSGPPATNYSYFAFAITVTNGFQANLSNISFDDRASGTGPTAFDVQVSQQSTFSSIIYDSGAQSTHGAFSSTPMNSFTMNSSALTGTIYIRIYAYGASSTSGTWRLDNLNLQGEITPIQNGGGGWYVDSIFVEDATCCGTPAP